MQLSYVIIILLSFGLMITYHQIHKLKFDNSVLTNRLDTLTKAFGENALVLEAIKTATITNSNDILHMSKVMNANNNEYSRQLKLITDLVTTPYSPYSTIEAAMYPTVVQPSKEEIEVQDTIKELISKDDVIDGSLFNYHKAVNVE